MNLSRHNRHAKVKRFASSKRCLDSLKASYKELTINKQQPAPATVAINLEKPCTKGKKILKVSGTSSGDKTRPIRVGLYRNEECPQAVYMTYKS